MDRALPDAVHFFSRRAGFGANKELGAACAVVPPQTNGGDHGQRYIALASRHSNPDYHSTASLLALEAEMAETSHRSSDVAAMEPIEKREPRVAGASKIAASANF